MKRANRSQSLPVFPLHRPEMDWEVMKVFSLYRRLEGADDLSPVERASLVYSGPATYAVGQIPELVDVILGFTSKLSLYNCLFVCKAYSNIATQHLWRDLPSAIPLLKLLGPIVTMGEPGLTSASWVFRTPPSQTRWENFHAHAKYVQTISQPSCAWNHGTTDLDWPVEPTQSYREPEFGPKCCRPGFCPISSHALETLETGNSMVPPRCLTPNLERLTFTFGNTDTSPTSFLSFLAPKLITLNLLYHACLWKTYEREGLDSLQRFISDSLRALSGWDYRGVLRHIHRLQICFDEKQFALWRGYVEVNDAILGVLDHCTELRYIKLPPFLEHERLLSTIQKFRQLSSLSVSFNTPQEMVSFAQGIASSLPNIRKLGLGHRGYAPTPKEQLFNPLLKLHNLVEFSIKKYARNALIDLADVPPWLLTLPFLQELSTAWPKLESLRLHPPNYVDLESLKSFQDSDLFPNLTYLSIDIENVIYQQLTAPMLAVAAAARLMRPLRSLRLLDIDTRVETFYDGFSEPFALITYAERLGPSGMRILVNGELPRGELGSVA